jgi:phosphoenolpyruvate-protein kinase (PTS system EI component)
MAGSLAPAGDQAILVRPNIDTAGFEALAAASCALTAMGGRTAHASLIARQMGKACVVSCTGLEVDVAARRAKIGDALIEEGTGSRWTAIPGKSSSDSAKSSPNGPNRRWRKSMPGVPRLPGRRLPWQWQSELFSKLTV